ncbi:MAG: hypothetical protein WC829_09390 [Hyphomicrobium sp.]|jgi:hypothetical protein
MSGNPKKPTARETRGEGAPQRKRREGMMTAEDKADPKREDDRGDGRLIDRRPDARNREGL